MTTIEDANEHLINRSYDLVPFRKAGIESGRIVEIIMQESNGLWEEIDGSGGGIFIVSDVMTIRQAYQVQREVSELLKAILDSGQSPHGIYHAEEAACRKTLQKPVTVNFSDLPLIDVIQFLAANTNSRMFLDKLSIEEAGLLLDEPISLVMKGQTLATTLHFILRDLELTTLIQSGELFITTIEVANERVRTVVYDVRKIQEPEQLHAAMESLTSGLWENVDGASGTMSLTGNGLLVVRQTDEIHREVAAVLRMFMARGTN